jgi:hypothetical protein
MVLPKAGIMRLDHQADEKRLWNSIMLLTFYTYYYRHLQTRAL